MQEAIRIKNRKASFEYHFIDTYVAGIQLLGTEIKAIREGKANLVDAYCHFIKEELFISNLNISEYSLGTYANHEPRRMRKLLLKKKELKKLRGSLKEKGLTIIPLSLFINDKGFAKLDIALSKGKKLYDKREDIKAKDVKRDLDRLKKRF